jgi:hypothetical protein
MQGSWIGLFGIFKRFPNRKGFIGAFIIQEILEINWNKVSILLDVSGNDGKLQVCQSSFQAHHGCFAGMDSVAIALEKAFA